MNYDSVLNDKVLRAYQVYDVYEELTGKGGAFSPKQKLIIRNSLQAELTSLVEDIKKLCNADGNQRDG